MECKPSPLHTSPLHTLSSTHSPVWSGEGLMSRHTFAGSHGVVLVLCGHVLTPHLAEATRAHGHAELSWAGLLRRMRKRTKNGASTHECAEQKKEGSSPSAEGGFESLRIHGSSNLSGSTRSDAATCASSARAPARRIGVRVRVKVRVKVRVSWRLLRSPLPRGLGLGVGVGLGLGLGLGLGSALVLRWSVWQAAHLARVREVESLLSDGEV